MVSWMHSAHLLHFEKWDLEMLLVSAKSIKHVYKTHIKGAVLYCSLISIFLSFSRRVAKVSSCLPTSVAP